MIQYKEIEETEWRVLPFPPEWEDVKNLASKWYFAVREVNDQGFVSREFYPSSHF